MPEPRRLSLSSVYRSMERGVSKGHSLSRALVRALVRELVRDTPFLGSPLSRIPPFSDPPFLGSPRRGEGWAVLTRSGDAGAGARHTTRSGICLQASPVSSTVKAGRCRIRLGLGDAQDGWSPRASEE